VKESVAVNAISNNDAMRFGLDKSNKGNQIMRKMGWRKGSIGEDNEGIATALTGQSIGGQTNRAGLGSKQGGASNSSERSGGARQRKQQKCKRVQHQRKVRWVDTEMKITMRRDKRGLHCNALGLALITVPDVEALNLQANMTTSAMDSMDPAVCSIRTNNGMRTHSGDHAYDPARTPEFDRDPARTSDPGTQNTNRRGTQH
jgi:hypothetical protein